MFKCMGETYKSGAPPTLPTPLEEGAPPRVVGGREVHTPDWEKSASSPVNYEFISAAVSMLINNGDVSGTQSQMQQESTHISSSFPLTCVRSC